MNVLKVFLLCCAAAYVLFLESCNLMATCAPIKIDEFSQCVESCIAREDKTQFETERSLTEYCVEQCVVTLRKCAYE